MTIQAFPKVFKKVIDDTTAKLQVFRVKVPGGYLVTVFKTDDKLLDVTFLADYNWTWDKIES